MSLLVGIIFAVLAFSANFKGVTPLAASDDGTLSTKNGVTPVEAIARELIKRASAEEKLKGSVLECPDDDVYDEYTSSCVKDILMPHRMKRGDAVNKTEDEKSCNASYACKDCNTIRVCANMGKGHYTFLNDTICSEPTPYCNKETMSCSSQPSVGCFPKYACTAEGYFPDASKCNIYHVCVLSSGVLTAETFQCRVNEVYSPLKKMCVSKETQKECHVVKCPENITSITGFPGLQSFYALCVEGEPKYVFDCGNLSFNNSTKMCEVSCTDTGRLPDKNDCRQFYECTKMASGFAGALMKCPLGTIYDNSKGYCVTGECN